MPEPPRTLVVAWGDWVGGVAAVFLLLWAVVAAVRRWVTGDARLPARRERLQAALQAAGHPMRLTVELGPVVDSPAKRLAVAAAARMVAAEELIQSDPLVQAMVRDFGARIVPGSIQPL